jgi:hypothetical protein
MESILFPDEADKVSVVAAEEAKELSVRIKKTSRQPLVTIDSY